MILWDITWLLRALSENANRVTASTYLLVLWMTSIFCWSLRPNGLLMGRHKILVYNWCFQVLCYSEYRIFPIDISWLRQICFFAPNTYNAHHRIWDHCNIITGFFYNNKKMATVQHNWIQMFSSFITPILKSPVVPVIWLALIGEIYSWITPFCYKLHLFLPANEQATLKTKQPIRF